MKKLFLSTLILWGICGVTNAQNQEFIITDLDGVEYENNSVHVFTEFSEDEVPNEDAKLPLRIFNTTNSDIYVSAEVVEIINTDGSEGQFCIGGPAGNCWFSISVGSFYPSSTGGVLPSNGDWGNYDYLTNRDETNLAEYKLRFVQFDGAGSEIPNTSFYISYRYDKNAMGVSDVNSIAIAEVYPTVAKGSTTVQLKENANVQIFNLEGKAVKSLKLNSGKSNLDLSGLSSGVYLVQFKGTSGLTHTTKIVVK